MSAPLMRTFRQIPNFRFREIRRSLQLTEGESSARACKKLA